MELELCVSFEIKTSLNKRLLTNPFNDNFPRRNSDFKRTISWNRKKKENSSKAEVNKALEARVDKVDYNQGST